MSDEAQIDTGDQGGRTISAGAATTLPSRDARGRIPDDAIAAVVDQIVRKYRPARIILFGSYANGSPRPESDVDLLVVMDTPLREAVAAATICRSIDYHFGLDLIVRTPATLARRSALGDPFIREILDKGKILYERADGRVG
jgi:predicted nucleotidyltransferase